MPMMAIPPVIGVILVLVGLGLFLVDLNVTNHGLPTAGSILALLAGGLALFGAGVPYSGVLLGTIAVVTVLMGACSSASWAHCAVSKGGQPSPAGKG